MSPAPRIGLRQLLIGLSLAGIVPLAIVATVLVVALWRAQQGQLHDSARATAHALAASVQQGLDSTVRRLRLLASLEVPENPQAFEERRREALAASPDWTQVTLVSQQAAAPRQAAVFEGQVAVSDLLLAQGSREPRIEIGVPVMRDGRAAYGLFATLQAHELSELLRLQLRHADSVAVIVDAQQRIIARTRDPARYIGERLITPLQAAVQRRPSGVERLPLYDGPDVYSAWTPIGETGWTLILGVPAAPADAALARSLAAFGALLAIVLAASGVFAWLIGRRLAGAIHAAAGAAVALSEGRRAQPPSASRIAEVQTLTAAIERSAARLASAEEERIAAAAERDRVLADEQRARAQAEAASRAKDEFLALLGHELRNPLGAIANALRMLDRAPPASADHKAARDIVTRQTRHLAKIVDDLLDVGRVVSGRIVLRRNLVELSQAIGGAVSAARAGEQEGAHLWTLELAPVLASADATRIDQVLANLLDNALKFTPKGGSITVRLYAEAGEAVFCVEDTGPGIPAELLPHVFELFTREQEGAEARGLGIGLALVKRLVELHGGRVHAENRRDGPGARFVVRLPAIPEPEPGEANLRPLPAPRPARKARVLVVEDNDDARVMLQRLLQTEGHLVSAAGDAGAGLEAAQAGSPNIAIIDIGLPGMDGYELARALRERFGAGLRLIALTGYGTEVDRQRSAEAGFDAHLTKPVDIDRLLALIAEAGV